jgi:hypothetical protein
MAAHDAQYGTRGQRSRDDMGGEVQSGVNATPHCWIERIRFDDHWRELAGFVDTLTRAARRTHDHASNR